MGEGGCLIMIKNYPDTEYKHITVTPALSLQIVDIFVLWYWGHWTHMSFLRLTTIATNIALATKQIFNQQTQFYDVTFIIRVNWYTIKLKSKNII